jgi:hypothetical protein
MRAPWEIAGRQSWFELFRHGGGGGESSSSTSQSTSTSNQDNRSAADTGSVAASGGASLSDVQVYNTSSDPAVITAALQSVEQQGQVAAGTINDLAHAALHENAALSQDAIDQWAGIVSQALGGSQTAITDALGALANQSASTSAIASQALGQVAPLQTSLKILIYAGAAVAIVFFLSRGSK